MRSGVLFLFADFTLQAQSGQRVAELRQNRGKQRKFFRRFSFCYCRGKRRNGKCQIIRAHRITLVQYMRRLAPCILFARMQVSRTKTYKHDCKKTKVFLQPLSRICVILLEMPKKCFQNWLIHLPKVSAFPKN